MRGLGAGKNTVSKRLTNLAYSVAFDKFSPKMGETFLCAQWLKVRLFFLGSNSREGICLFKGDEEWRYFLINYLKNLDNFEIPCLGSYYRLI